MRKKLIAQIHDGVIATAQNAAVAVLRLQQISNGFVVPEDSDEPMDLFAPRTADNPRLVALEEVLKDREPGPVIIWCRFRYDVELICQHYQEALPLYGAMSAGQRERSVKAWLQLGGKLVATPGTGGTGLNLQHGGCSTAIYYSNSENFVHRVQSEDRIHRIGSLGERCNLL